VFQCTSQIDKAILREVAVAKELIAAKRKERALLALKKKKLHEQQLDRVDAFLLNIEQVKATRGPYNSTGIIWVACNGTSKPHRVMALL
jgi:hypothetical protein